MRNGFLIQSIKYGIVGIINTLVCFVVIWTVLKFGYGIIGEKKATGIEITVSNVLGYIAGLLTSFFLNRKWTFQSNKSWKPEFVKFVSGVLICYIPQLIVVNLLNRYSAIHSMSLEVFGHNYTLNSSLICNIVGMVFYTVINFIYNKYYTFKK
jgi:putative flippase GtrA